MTEEQKQRFLRIKRALFEKADSDLNPEQRLAVYTTEGPLLVFAGAGSGKTTVLVRRAAQIIRYGRGYFSERVPVDLSEQTLAAYEEALSLSPAEIRPLLDAFAEDACPPYRVMAITFTNKAANEIKTRLSSGICDGRNPEDIWAGTFHSVCMRILRAHPEAAGLSGQITIYDTDDTKKLLTDVMKNLGINDSQFPVKTVAGAISHAKERLVGPDDFVSSGFREGKIAEIYAEYQRRLEAACALDFDDIIMKTVLALQKYPGMLNYYSGKFRYILVDEYQDTNPAQFELVKLLSQVHKNIMVVGDDDQSIYRFRGATVENILSFEKSFPGASVVKLERNYRSTGNILGAANAIIGKNPRRARKVLWTDRGDGPRVRIEELADGDAEARRIVEIIQTGVASGKYRFRDFAVLYRVNAQSNAIERTFARSALPYRIFGGQRFADRKEIRDVVAYLQLIVNRSDTTRLLRIINEPRRQIGQVTVDAVLKIAAETGRTPFDVMKHASEYPALARAASKLTAFTAVIDRLGEILEGGCPLDSFIKQTLDMTGYRQMLIDGGEEEADRLDNVDEFISNAVEYSERTEEPTLAGFLEENALVSDIDKYDEGADACVLMTVHSAKGLEFPVCILCGMEDGLFPSLRFDADEGEIEEERRLCYVAVTRARNELYILHARSRLLYGRTVFNEVSRFVKDIPPEVSEETDMSFQSSGWNDWRRPARRDSGFGSGAGSGSGRRYATRGDEKSGSAGALKKKSAPSGSNVLTVGKKSSPPPPPAETFKPGERVLHPAFGEGTVISAAAMGSDVLYEVIFDDYGTKKLMGRYARLRRP